VASSILRMSKDVVNGLVVPFGPADVRHASAVEFTSDGIDSLLHGYEHLIKCP